MTAPSQQPPASWRSYLLVALIVLAGHLLVFSGHLMSPDDELLFRTTESLATRGTLAIHPIEYDELSGQLVVPPNQTFATVQGRGGEFYAQYLPLQSLLGVPLVWLARLTAPAFAEGFSATLPDTPTHPALGRIADWSRAVVVIAFNPIVGALTAIFLMRIAMFLTAGNRRASIASALLWAFTTMAWPHARTYFTEPLAGLGALVALDQVLRWYRTPLVSAASRVRLRQMTVVGLAMAAAIWTRMDSPLLAFGLGVTLVVAGEWKRRAEGAWAISPGRWPFADYAVAGGIIVASFALLLVFNSWRFGGTQSLLGGGYDDQQEGVKFSTSLLVGLHGFLLSPGKGLFFFSPGLILGLWGWRRVPAHLRWAGWIVFGAFLPFALAMAMWQNWDGGWCWGPRHIYQIHAPIMLGAAFLFDGCGSMFRRVAIRVLAIVGGAVQLFGSLQSPMDFYHEMFRTPADGIYYRVAYRPFEYPSILNSYRVFRVNPSDGSTGPQVYPDVMPSPLVESLYLPQQSQWNGYPLMLKIGYCDWWLLERVLPDRDRDGALLGSEPSKPD